jgi:ribonuclease VapC
LAAWVLDASALLCVIFREPGHRRVVPTLDDACMSTVNLAEVLTRILRDGQPIEGILTRFERFPIEWVPFSDIDAGQSAQLWPITGHAGLSLGDRACLALAIGRSLPAVTTDRVWAGLGLPIQVELIR